MQSFSFTARFVESANDDPINITPNERTCVAKAFRGNGFRLKGTLYNQMFVSKSFKRHFAIYILLISIIK